MYNTALTMLIIAYLFVSVHKSFNDFEVKLECAVFFIANIQNIYQQ